MALPKIDAPIFDVKLISTGQTLKFRPFTVKEEKLFLIAYESNDIKTTTDTIVQILNNCIIDNLDVRKLPIFDIENIFLNLRSRSVGEVIKLNYRCNNTVTDDKQEEKKCNNRVEIELNLLNIVPQMNEKHNSKIELSDKLGIVMKYPTLEVIEKIKALDEIDAVIEMIIECVDYIYDEENVYYAKYASKEELMEFIDSLSTKDLEKIKDFFDTLPKLTKKIEFKCNKCGYTEDIVLEGIESFFV